MAGGHSGSRLKPAHRCQLPPGPPAEAGGGQARPAARTLVLLAVITGLLCGGCGLFCRRLGPVPPALTREEVVSTLQARARGCTTVTDASASLRVQFEVNGEVQKQPTLGILLAFDGLRPGLWLRGEKLGQKIFTLRAGADYFWLEIPDTQEVVTGGPAAYGAIPGLVNPYEVMLWFGSPDWVGLTWPATTMTVEPEHYRFDVAVGGLPIRSVFVDRRTVTVSRIVSYDAFRRPRTEVLMEDYDEVGAVQFPYRLTVLRHQEGCRLEIRLGRPRLNKPIEASAFAPPPRPGWRHIDLDHEPITSVKAFGGQ